MNRYPPPRIFVLIVLAYAFIGTAARSTVKAVNADSIEDSYGFDYVFLLDGSDSTGSESFEKAKEFLKKYIHKVLKNKKSRVAIIQYSSVDVKTELTFDETNIPSDVEKIITKMALQGGKKETVKGLESMKTTFESLNGVSYRTGIILTDGKEEEAPVDTALEVDLMFMIDITGSMSEEIDEVKRKILAMVDDIRKKYKTATFRVGFVGYRDEFDAVRFQIRPFDANVQDFKEWVQDVKADGGAGSGLPEDVIGAMRKVLEQNWNAPLTRLLVHIADASDQFWADHRTEGKRIIHKLLKQMRCQTKIFNYIFVKGISGDTTLPPFIDVLDETSNIDCQHSISLTGENTWFIKQDLSGASIKDIVIKQTKVAIKGVSFVDISEKLKNEAGVDIIGIGITDNADKEKLDFITGNPTKTIVPQDDEDIQDQIEHVEEIVKDVVCDADHCSNAGTCKKIEKSLTCICGAGYSGDTCTDICVINPCKNGGTCQNIGNAPKCTCAPGYIGTFCKDIDDCAMNPCSHGTCQDESNDFTCTCETGWEGKKCEKDINDCAMNPCEHGTCQDELNGFTCTCEPGWGGKTCDQADAEEMTLRLVDKDGKNSTTFGRLEVFHKGSWGSFCSKNFVPSAIVARIICQTIGSEFKTGVVYVSDLGSSGYFAAETGPIWFDYLWCKESHKIFSDCLVNSYDTQDCTHVQDVGVECKEAGKLDFDE